MLPALITCHKFDSLRCQCGLIVSGKQKGGGGGKRGAGVFPHSFELQNINDALIAANGIQIVPLCALACLAAQLNRRAIKTREEEGEWDVRMGTCRRLNGILWRTKQLAMKLIFGEQKPKTVQTN